MQMVAVITRQDFEAALAASREVGKSAGNNGLAAPLDGAFIGRIREVWDDVESALTKAFQFGAEYAKESIDAAVKAANDLMAQAGKGARAVQQELLKRVQAYLSTLVDTAIEQVRPAVAVGDRKLALETVDISYSVSLGGSLGVTIANLASLTSTGEITISAHYISPS
jgi:hypothetical protein